MSGMVGILNVGAGDVELSFDPRNPAERIRAARIVKDMIRRGYALLIEIERAGEKRYERALDFDEQACRYIVADMDPLQARETDMADAAAELRAQQKQQEQALQPFIGTKEDFGSTVGRLTGSLEQPLEKFGAGAIAGAAAVAAATAWTASCRSPTRRRSPAPRRGAT